MPVNLYRPILCLDFDGVIHEYRSGWKGAREIPDPPVPGAFEFIDRAQKHFRVAIHSSRSHQFGGRRAMKKWMRENLEWIGLRENATPQWWFDRIAQSAFADPWDEEVRDAARLFVKSILWPKYKPPATITIDDRGYRFEGDFSVLDPIELVQMRPWNKKPR